ncbi:MAG: AbrB/MazE/SpoVT family DNA-binding domain-containing protein [Candidatus Aenigmatarchaeota archaeon]
MSEQSIVTRGGQITLTKEIRERLGIKEGDKVILNISGDTVMVSKRDPKIFDKFDDFLPQRFDNVLSKIRLDEKERLRRLGIVE